MEGTAINFFLQIFPHEADPNYTPGVDFLDQNFLSSKTSGKDLSNKGSNLILSLLEVGHRVAQT